MRSLLAAWLITLLSLSNLAAVDQPSHFIQAGTPITLDDYWNLVRDTWQVIGQLDAKPEATIRSELSARAAAWEQVTAVKLPDDSVIQIDPSYMTVELRREPPDLERLGNILEALLRAHEQYPQKVFTPEDVFPLNEILARPEFQWKQAEQPLRAPDWLANLWERFLNFLDRVIFATATAIYEGRTLFKIAGAILFTLALFFIARSLSHNLVREAQLAAEG
ncbi:MAG TPA: hypothetical protein VFQ13_17330, partial [Anaerolineales bacterium]|nr:hypothetical protein [Anaerolineales bacterium]